MERTRTATTAPDAADEPAKAEDVDVLVIDDSDIARRAMVRTLSRAGMTVAESDSPIGASRIIIRQNVRVVVIDVNMPALSGDKLVALFRQNPRIKHVRLVLVSGLEAELVGRLAADLSVDAVVPKAEGPEALVKAVSGLLRRSRASG